MQTARSKTRAAAAEGSKRYRKVGLADCGSDLGLDIIGREKGTFHFPFCYEWIVRSESAGFMESVSDFLTFIYRHETLFFYIRKFYVF